MRTVATRAVRQHGRKTVEPLSGVIDKLRRAEKPTGRVNVGEG